MTRNKRNTSSVGLFIMFLAVCVLFPFGGGSIVSLEPVRIPSDIELALFAILMGVGIWLIVRDRRGSDNPKQP